MCVRHLRPIFFWLNLITFSTTKSRRVRKTLAILFANLSRKGPKTICNKKLCTTQNLVSVLSVIFVILMKALIFELIKYFFLLAWTGGLDMQGPQFDQEPPHRLEFSNSSGGRADCSAHGSPQPETEWIGADGQPLQPIPDIRHVYANGTIVFPPFTADRYRHDVHATIYRCRVKSSVGLLLSREMHVRAGKVSTWIILIAPFTLSSLQKHENFFVTKKCKLYLKLRWLCCFRAFFEQMHLSVASKMLLRTPIELDGYFGTGLKN